MAIKCIGVAGCGVMGRGLAQSLARSGLEAVIVDVSRDILERGREEIAQGLRFYCFQNKEFDPDEAMGRIRFETSPEMFRDVDFLVENITEKPELKESLYREIDRLCRPDCVFAANTSAISITRIASWTERPDRVIGMHFMNPVPMKPLVEVIRGWRTSDETVGTAGNFLAAIGKKGVVVNDMPGFVSNRVLMLMVNEAIWLVQDGVAKAKDIDEIFRSCFGHKMGPLETADLIGLDTILYSLDVLFESYRDSKFRPCPLLVKMVDAGLLGRKSGAGFHTY
ncbi:MAG: 3-hydroxyacyl-CoA dehydrogenase family protein [Candidatus Latescibacterota bacterium]